MLLKLSLFFLFAFTALHAETRNYLVLRSEHFPQDRYLYSVSPQEYRFFVDAGKRNISEAGGQPFRLTSYQISPDGKYALWTVSFRDADERWHLDSMERQGYIVLLSSSDVVSRYDSRVGGSISEMFSIVLSSPPIGYFSVEPSTSIGPQP